MAGDRVQVVVRVRPILPSEHSVLGLDPDQAANVSQPAVVAAADGKTVTAELPVDFANGNLINSSSAPAMTCTCVEKINKHHTDVLICCMIVRR